MKRRRLSTPISCTILLVLVAANVIFNRCFPVVNDSDSIRISIVEYIRQEPVDITCNLDVYNKKVVFFKLGDGRQGSAVFTHGFDNRYKLDYADSGNSTYRYEFVDTNSGRYLVISVENYNLKVSYINFMYEGAQYGIDMSDKKVRAVYFKVPDNSDSRHIDTESLRYYDGENKDITYEISCMHSSLLRNISSGE